MSVFLTFSVRWVLILLKLSLTPGYNAMVTPKNLLLSTLTLAITAEGPKGIADTLMDYYKLKLEDWHDSHLFGSLTSSMMNVGSCA